VLNYLLINLYVTVRDTNFFIDNVKLYVAVTFEVIFMIHYDVVIFGIFFSIKFAMKIKVTHLFQIFIYHEF
jgi:hypothetical protein